MRQASSRCPLNSRSQPSDLRSLAPSTQALGRAGRTALVSQYHALSARKQLWAGAPWEPLPSQVIKCIFYHINCFPLTSNSAWPAASTSFPLLTALQQFPRLQASFCMLSLPLACPGANKLFALLYNSLPRVKQNTLQASLQPQDAQLLSKGQGTAGPSSRSFCDRNCFLSQWVQDWPTWPWFMYLKGRGAPVELLV